MSADSKIEWTDATWNPVRGCDAVSPGCLNCYAAGVAARFSGPGLAYEGTATRKPGQQAKWTGKIILAEDKLTVPLKWREPRRIFVNSMSDLFHEDVPDEYIDRVFAVMASAPQHTFQILTKRADRMAKFLAESTREGGRWDHLLYDGDFPFPDTDAADVGYDRITDEPVLSNVWLGVSVEDQQRADERIPHLLATPATVRFLSCEPLLGPVKLDLLRLDVGNPAHCICGHGHGFTRCPNTGGIARICHHADGICMRFQRRPGSWNGIDWIIVGGESGHGARPMHPDWARSLRDQCQAAGVPFFFKQWGEFIHPHPSEFHLSPAPLIDFDGLKLQRVGKKAAGRLLDGRTWDEFPTASN